MKDGRLFIDGVVEIETFQRLLTASHVVIAIQRIALLLFFGISRIKNSG